MGVLHLCEVLAARTKLVRFDLSRYPVARALAISVLAHMLLFIGAEAGRKAGLWNTNPMRELLDSALMISTQSARAERERLKPEENREPPLMFVDVDPAQAVDQPPAEAKYYSSRNTKAANPETADTDKPKIDGQQERVVKTFDTALPKPQPAPTPPAPTPLTPDPPSPSPTELVQTPPKELAKPVETVEPPKPEVAQTKPKPEPELAPETPLPKPAVEPGDLAFNQPSPKVRQEAGAPPVQSAAAQPRTRPRTVAEAKRLRGEVQGDKMKQEGGVKNWGVNTTLDTRSTTFGAYDAAIIAAIQQRWYDLLEQRKFAFERSGKVVLEFHLTNDGRITDLKVNDNDVGDFWGLICQKAIEDPAPYGPWTQEMRREIGRNFREVKFTFFYN